jgi:AraC-like DNA-binding protein
MMDIDEPIIEILTNSYNKTFQITSTVLLIVIKGSNSLKIDDTHLKISSSITLLLPYGEFSISGDGEVYVLFIPKNILLNLLGRSICYRIKNFFKDRLDNYNMTLFKIENEQNKFKSICRGINCEVNSKELNYIDVVELHIVEILFLLKRVGVLDSEDVQDLTSKSFIWDIDDTIRYLKNNYDSQFTLNEIAGKCALNPSYFSRSFRSVTGIPLFEYINRLRVDKACHLLKVSSSSIIDIAFSVGYNNISFFNRYFKKIMDISPGEYRKMVRK